MERAKASGEEKADLVSVQTPPGVPKHFVCMGSGRWINCPVPEEGSTWAGHDGAETQVTAGRAVGN